MCHLPVTLRTRSLDGHEWGGVCTSFVGSLLHGELVEDLRPRQTNIGTSILDRTRFARDLVDSSVFIAGNAVVLGDVTLAARASVWFGAVVRGDAERICVGRETNIQDLCVLHADPGFPCLIGSQVTVGHAAIVHGAEVEDGVMIGMRSVVMNGARIGAGSIIGAGAIVPEGKQIPPGSVVLGVPGRIAREATAEDSSRIQAAALHYAELGACFRANADHSSAGECQSSTGE